jgi:serine/threonine-protein kinase
VPQTLADHNLLAGVLALQLDLVGQNDWAAAARELGPDGDAASLVDEFRRSGALSDEECDLLAALVNRHLQRHNNDPLASLAQCDSDGQMRRLMSAVLGDSLPPASAETIGHAPAGDPHATRISNSPSADEATHNGAGDVSLVGDPTAPLPPGAAPRRVFAPLSKPAVERFRILRPFAKGGLGQVLLARDEELGREVAFKEILPAHADKKDVRQRFLVEAEITGSLEHPGIVPVYGLGQYADGRPFYAMRLIRGDNLLAAIDEFHKQQHAPDRELRFRALLGRLIDVCNTMEYAHNRCVIHRDIKPGNIMLGKYGETLVVDWGLAKTLGSEAAPADFVEHPVRPASADKSTGTVLGRIVGTPAYMSPEQASGRIDLLGPATDVYSLGATLYHLLVGRAPFQTDDPDQLLGNVQLGRFDPPRAVKHDVPKPLEAICLKAMARQPAERYASARQLADDVERYLADEPILAQPDSPVRRIGRWARKHRGLVASGGFALAAACASLAAGLLMLSEANLRVRVGYRQARNAIANVISTVKDDATLQDSEFQSLRETLLKDLLDYEEKLLKSQEVNGADLDDVAQANYAVGAINDMFDNPDRALEYYQKAADAGQQLVAQSPRDEARLEAQARTLDAMGGALERLDRLSQAREHYARAATIREQLVELNPDNAEYQKALAATSARQSQVEMRRNGVEQGNARAPAQPRSSAAPAPSDAAPAEAGR